LNRIRPQPVIQIFEINKIEMLVLIETREDEKFFARVRVDVPLQTLGADFLHHTLHRAVD
jgi:hypothetical protein